MFPRIKARARAQNHTYVSSKQNLRPELLSVDYQTFFNCVSKSTKGNEHDAINGNAYPVLDLISQSNRAQWTYKEGRNINGLTLSEKIAAKLIILVKNVIYLVLYSLSRLFMRQKRISILLYHSIDLNNAHHNVNPVQFEMQMEYLRKKYDVVSLDTILNFIKEGKALPKKPVAITFDDGYYNVYQNAYPVLKKCRFPAAVFITTGYVQKHKPLNRIQLRMLGWNEIREMSNNDVTIGAHTITHPNLEQVDLETAEKEIQGSREEIEENIGKDVRYFASPYGKENEEIVNLVRSIGFDYAFGRLSSKEFIQKGAKHLILNRTEIDSSVAFWMFKVKLTKAVEWYQKFEEKSSKIVNRFSFLSKVDHIYNMLSTGKDSSFKS